MNNKETNSIMDKHFIIKILLAIYLVGIMVINLTHSSLWGDEWIEFDVSNRGILNGKMYDRVITTFQPPLYNWFMHFWLKIDVSVIWFRSFNILVGVITLLFIYKSLRMLINERDSLIAMFIFGSLYQWIYCVQECSEYCLMVCLLAGSIYFFIKVVENYRLSNLLLMVLMCVGAIYSQYGAFFVIMPILVIYMVHTFIAGNRKAIIQMMVVYMASLVLFAIPLYLFYASIQLGHNEIGNHTGVSIGLSELLNFFVVFGGIAGFFLNILQYKILYFLIAVIGLIIAIAGIYLIKIGAVDTVSKYLIIGYFVSYIMYYVLVTLHIYAMVHADESSGYYSRYGYFFLPYMIIAFSIIFSRSFGIVIHNGYQNMVVVSRVITVVYVVLFLFSVPGIVTNWDKSRDDEAYEVWYNNAGFEETTYLLGAARVTYKYYKNYVADIDFTGEAIRDKNMNIDDLPDSFWIWESGWEDYYTFDEIINVAESNGYDVTIYYNGLRTKLAHCVAD